MLYFFDFFESKPPLAILNKSTFASNCFCVTYSTTYVFHGEEYLTI